MSHQKNVIKTVRLSLSTTTQVREALAQLARTGLWGRNPAEVASRLISQSLIDRIRNGELELPDVDDSESKANIYSLEPDSPIKEQDSLEIVAPHIVSASYELIRRLREAPQDIYTITPREFEEVVAALLSDMGWDVHLTPATRDGGIDVLAYSQTEIGRLLCLIESKRYRQDRPVGIEVVRNLYGALHHVGATSGMIATTSYFSEDAKRFVSQHEYQLSLRDYQDVSSWIQGYRSGHR